jgi:hypothetical protein
LSDSHIVGSLCSSQPQYDFHSHFSGFFVQWRLKDCMVGLFKRELKYTFCKIEVHCISWKYVLLFVLIKPNSSDFWLEHHFTLFIF